jgi:hypothetical protein
VVVDQRLGLVHRGAQFGELARWEVGVVVDDEPPRGVGRLHDPEVLRARPAERPERRGPHRHAFPLVADVAVVDDEEATDRDVHGVDHPVQEVGAVDDGRD